MKFCRSLFLGRFLLLRMGGNPWKAPETQPTYAAIWGNSKSHVSTDTQCLYGSGIKEMSFMGFELEEKEELK